MGGAHRDEVEKTDAELFLALAHIPHQVVARVSRRLPGHIDIDDLLSAANEGLLLSIRRHRDKPFDDIAKISWRRCAGAVRDELRAMVPIRGARRHGARAKMVSLAVLPYAALSYVPPEPTMILGAVQRAFASLPPRYQRVVFGRALGRLDSETAKEFGVSEPRIAQIFAKAILKMQGSVRKP